MLVDSVTKRYGNLGQGHEASWINKGKDTFFGYSAVDTEDTAMSRTSKYTRPPRPR